MKKIHEVCDSFGITRRTLQEYDKFGLLKHTTENALGHWLYDDVAIQKLALITIFVEAGYQRKEIKHILYSDKIDIVEEYDKTINKLKAKRNKINDMIKELMVASQEIKYAPKRSADILRKIPLNQFLNGNSFKSMREAGQKRLSLLGESDISECGEASAMAAPLVAICVLKGNSLDDSRISDCFADLLNVVRDLFLAEDPDITMQETADELLFLFNDMYESTDIPSALDEQFGNGAADFFMKVIKYQCERIIKN